MKNQEKSVRDDANKTHNDAIEVYFAGKTALQESAPDLLAACKAWLAWAEHQDPNYDDTSYELVHRYGELFDQTRAAIARATA